MDSNIKQYDFKEVMKACVVLYGHDTSMESAKNIDELLNWIGDEFSDEAHKVVNYLNEVE